MDSRPALLISHRANILIEVASGIGHTCCSSKRAHVWVCVKSQAAGVGRCGEGHMELDTRLLQRGCAESCEAPPPSVSIGPGCSTQGSINPPNVFAHGGFFSRVNICVIQKVQKHKMKDWPTSQGHSVYQKIKMLALCSKWYLWLCEHREASGYYCTYSL